MKKAFLIHTDSLCVLDDLTDEQKGQLFYAIYKYHAGESINLPPIIKVAFSQFKKQFERDAESYKKTAEQRRKAGSKGGKQKVANASKCKQKVANVADNDISKDIYLPAKELQDEFESIWKDYHAVMKSQGRRGGSKKTALDKFVALRKKTSLEKIKNAVALEKSLKLGQRDLERILTADNICQVGDDKLDTSLSGQLARGEVYFG